MSKVPILKGKTSKSRGQKICRKSWLKKLEKKGRKKLENLPWFTGRLISYWTTRGSGSWTPVQSVIIGRWDIVIGQSWKSETCTKMDGWWPQPKKWRWTEECVVEKKQEKREKKIQISSGILQVPVEQIFHIFLSLFTIKFPRGKSTIWKFNLTLSFKKCFSSMINASYSNLLKETLWNVCYFNFQIKQSIVRFFTSFWLWRHWWQKRI